MKLHLFKIILLLILSGCVSKPDTIIKVMSYNIHHAEGTDGVVSIDRIASVIQAESPDIVGLQEVDNGWKRSNYEYQAKNLAMLLNMNYVYEPSVFYGGNYGEMGNAILTKYEILSSKSYLLPSNIQQRSVLEVQLLIGGKVVTVLNTHFDLDKDSRIRSAHKIEELDSDILVGDLNGLENSAEINILKSIFDIAVNNSVDYIMTKNKIVSDKKIINDTVSSDHKPIIAIIKI